jgi:integrase
MNKFKSSVSIPNLLSKNLSNKKSLMKPSSYDTYKCNSEHLKGWLADQYIDEITIEFWDEFFAHLRERYSGSQTSQYKTVVIAVYKEAILEGLVSENLVKNINVGERSIQDKQKFSDDEINLLLYSVAGFKSEKALMQLAISTGLEIGELMAITVSDYDFASQKLLINKRLVSGKLVNTNKDGSTREVPLEPLAISAIEELAELAKDHCADECLFIDTSGKVEVVRVKFLAINSKTKKRYKSVDSFRSSFFMAYCELTNVRYLAPSNLRHTAIVRMIMCGGTLEWIVGQVGHTDVIKLKRHYGKWIYLAQQKNCLNDGDKNYTAQTAANDPLFYAHSVNKTVNKKTKYSLISFLKSLFSWGDKAA